MRRNDNKPSLSLRLCKCEPLLDLVSTARVYLESRRLRIAEQLLKAETLIRELQNFQSKITGNANDTYGTWREGTHDDLVIAFALALWSAVSL